MNHKNVKASVFIVVLYALLAGGSIQFTSIFSGCYGTVSLSRIAMAVRPTLMVLNAAKRISGETNDTISNAYLELGTVLRNKNIDTDQINSMERSLFIMNLKADSLESYLDQAESNGNSLFRLLKVRAHQNESFEDQMLQSIEKKEDEFDDKLEVANDVLEKIRKSVQKYDDILGYLQVTVAIEENYFEEIDRVISDGRSLDREIKVAIDEGIRVVEGYQSLDN